MITHKPTESLTSTTLQVMRRDFRMAKANDSSQSNNLNLSEGVTTALLEAIRMQLTEGFKENQKHLESLQESHMTIQNELLKIKTQIEKQYRILNKLRSRNSDDKEENE